MANTPEQPYLKVLNALRSAVDSGSLSPGDKYPSINELVKEHGVAPTTARRALTKLQEAGIAEPRHGIGWFVTVPPPPQATLEERVASLEVEVRELREQLDSRVS
ncbi:GntR family transcriptional regulator [Nocardiopsis algeriensis]|uniref:DNA-binding GntR family transcriptional regulator n=1 Tax=Nocardiopsis algeriensis TaxID=1478215 RepID=A0A841IU47_9ACTN|nr:winged helix-turn-helix domain-containing protein [Nocardiopsis algeriensis]MBB6122207.1 DNA-binding GntR family transcriptional regulator [Nocardiopsis algeriensis]